MEILAIAKLILMVAQYTMKYLSDHQLIDAGRGKAIAENLTHSMDLIDEARKIRAGITPDNADLGMLQHPSKRSKSNGDVSGFPPDLRE